MTKEDLGWDPAGAHGLEEGSLERVGRVRRAARGRYRVFTDGGEVDSELTGAFRYRQPLASDWPAVGDWVVLDADLRIHGLIPRRTELIRKSAGATTDQQVLAANAEVLLIVSGLDQDFNPRRLERYLLMAWEGGVEPVLVLNKADLHPNPDEARESAEMVAGGAPIIVGSAIKGDLLEAMNGLLRPRQTAALVGSSGVGKSTIVNALLGAERQRVQGVREGDDRGRHTTSHRELFVTEAGWILIDTPGLRELQVWGDAAAVSRAFQDVDQLAAQCRFGDCTHQGEPGCAVREALEAGEIEEERIANFHKLQKEAQYLEVKQDQRAALERKREWKAIHKAMRKGYHRGRWKG